MRRERQIIFVGLLAGVVGASCLGEGADLSRDAHDRAGSNADAGSGDAVGFHTVPVDAGSDAGSDVGARDDLSGIAPGNDAGPECDPRPLWVFLLAGQSNMVGAGYNSELSSADRSLVAATIVFMNSGIHANGNDGKWLPLGPGFGASEQRFGPELAFGRRLRERFPGQAVALLKVAEGSAALHDQWAANTGKLYQLLLAETQAQLAELSKSWRPQLAGLIWMQGEADAVRKETADGYQQAFTAFIGAVRSAVAVPLLPVVAGLIAPSSLWTYHAEVRNALVKVAATVGQVDTVETQDLKALPNDAAHFDSPSQLVLGQRFADAAADLLGATWGFPEGFSDVQGNGFWNYQSRAEDGKAERMAYDAENSRWHIPDQKYLLIGSGVMHPAAAQAELVWTAPYSGWVEVACRAWALNNEGGDGTVVSWAHGDVTIWGPRLLPNNSSQQHTQELFVEQNEQLRFRTAAGEDSLYDSTGWSVSIVAKPGCRPNAP